MNRRDFLKATCLTLAAGAAGCGNSTDSPPTGPNLAQAPPGSVANPTQRHGTGGLPAPPAEYAAAPKALTPDLLTGNGVAARLDKSLPSSYQLPANLTPPVQDQGWLESCGSFAIGYAVASIYAAKRLGLDLSQPGNQSAPAYIYKLAYTTEGLATCEADQSGPNSGTYAKEYFNALVDSGNPTIATVPYPNPNLSAKKMCQAIDAVDLSTPADPRFQIGSWKYISAYSDVNTIKAHLVAGNPVSILIGLYSNLDDSFVDSTGSTVFVGQGQPNNGGHFLCIIGYDDTLQAFLVQNSWGTGFGYQGRFWFSYDSYKQAVWQAHQVTPLVDNQGGTPMTSQVTGGSGGGVGGSVVKAHQAMASDGRVHLIFDLALSQPVTVEEIRLSRGSTRLRFTHQFKLRQGYVYVSRKDGSEFAPGKYKLEVIVQDSSGTQTTLTLTLDVTALGQLPAGELNAQVTGSHGSGGTAENVTG